MAMMIDRLKCDHLLRRANDTIGDPHDNDINSDDDDIDDDNDDDNDDDAGGGDAETHDRRDGAITRLGQRPTHTPISSSTL